MSDAVQTFRAISWIIVKWLLIAIAGLVALTALIIGGYFAFEWYTQGRHVANVVFLVEMDKDKCSSPQFPIYVGVGNGSSRTINRVSFTLQARKKGYSNNIARYDSYSSDKIIGPKEGFAWCWKVPALDEKVDDPSSLEWSILYKSIKFAD